MEVDTSKWSGEGSFTQVMIDALQQIAGIAAMRVEDAPASRSDAGYNFVSNEIFVIFTTVARKEATKRFGFLPGSKIIHERALTIATLEPILAAVSSIGRADYADDSMMQYLRTERIVPPYQTKGYKLVELVRIYDAAVAQPRP